MCEDVYGYVWEALRSGVCPKLERLILPKQGLANPHTDQAIKALGDGLSVRATKWKLWS